MAVKEKANIKNKVMDPLIFKISTQILKGRPLDYFIVLFDIVYPAVDTDPLIDEEIGTFKLPVEAAIQLYREKGEDQKHEYKDWINADLELTYLVSVYTDYQRFRQILKKKTFKEGLEEPAKLKKSTSEIPVFQSDIPSQEFELDFFSKSDSKIKKVLKEINIEE